MTRKIEKEQNTMKSNTVKKLKTCIIDKRRLNRPEFGESFQDITDVAELKKEIADTMEKKGRVYGIYDKKVLIGIYVFERQEDYFVKQDSSVKLGDKEFDLDQFWYGTSTEALKFKKCICLEEVNEQKEQLEEELHTDLNEQIELGQVAGVEWNDTLTYRKNLKEKSNGSIWGYLGGFALGFIFGWLVFDNLVMGLCFGPAYACLWGSVQLANTSGAEIDTLDFVQKEEVKEDATK